MNSYRTLKLVAEEIECGNGTLTLGNTDIIKHQFPNIWLRIQLICQLDQEVADWSDQYWDIYLDDEDEDEVIVGDLPAFDGCLAPDIADFVKELMANSGYLDDADELLGDYQDSEGRDAVTAKAVTIDRLVRLLNNSLPEHERMSERSFTRYVTE